MSGSDQANAILAGVQSPAFQPMSIPQMVSTQNGILQNVSLGRDLNMKQALGQSLKNNIDPQTGAVNMAGLLADAKNNPALAYSLQTFLPEGQTSNVTAQQLLQAKYQTAQQRAAAIDNLSQELALKGDKLTQDDLKTGVGTLLNNFPNDPAMEGDAMRFLAGANAMQGAGLQKYVGAYAAQNKDAMSQLSTAINANQFLNTGPTLDQATANPDTGKVSLNGNSIPLGMSPGDANTPVSVVSPGGPKMPPANTPMMILKKDLPGVGGTPAPSLPPTTGGAAAPQYPSTMAMGQQGATVSAPAVPAAAAGAQGLNGFVSGPSPNVAANAGANADTYHTEVQTVNQNIANGARALPLLQFATTSAQNLKTNGSTGARLALAQDVQKWLGGILPDKAVNGIAGGNLGQIQELDKVLATQMANQYGDIAGTKTADLYHTIMGSNPTIDKMPELFQGLQTIAENSLDYNRQEATFLNQNSSSQDPVADWAAYAQHVHLTPDNAASWAKENDPNAPMGGPAIMAGAANGSPSAQKVLSRLMQTSNTPVKFSGGRTYMWDSVTQQVISVPGAQ